MQKFTLLLILCAFQFSALAQQMTCLDKLLPFNRNSGVHMVTMEEWNDGKEHLDQETARNAMTFLVNSKLLCHSNDITIKIGPECSKIIADLPQSNACFIFTNLGYFVLSRDIRSNISFIFSRDRTFSESDRSL